MPKLPAALDSLRRLGLGRALYRLARSSRSRALDRWAGRALYPLPRALPESGAAGAAAGAGFEPIDPARDRIAPPATADLLRHRFRFLNLPPEDLSDPVDWQRAPDGDPLWGYMLHYGEWAPALGRTYRLTGEARYRDALFRLLADWLDANPVGQAPAWDPDPVSRRLVAFSRLVPLLAGERSWEELWRLRLEPSLRQQAAYLLRNLEHDVPNNHLLANYRALAWTGLLFPGWPESPRLRATGLAGLWREMERQVLPDGVHDERSISYHTLVLQDLLETWLLLRRTGGEPPAGVAPSLVRMLEFLAATRAPGGGWPMVNDSVPGYPIDPREVLAAGAAVFDRPDWLRGGGEDRSGYAHRLGLEPIGEPAPEAGPAPPVTVFPDAGLAVLRDATGYLLFDAGPMGPDRLPGHGHADALSFELHAAGRPLIVDPGVYTYSAGRWRDEFRSTRAHNTIAVDGRDQCEFWGPFRVAYPPAAGLLDWSDRHVAGRHQGYRRLPDPVEHRRTLRRTAPGVWEVRDRLDGRGRHRVELTLQFSPRARASSAPPGISVRWPDGARLEVETAELPRGARVEVEQGWVSTGWNLKTAAPRYVVSGSLALPIELRTWIRLVG